MPVRPAALRVTRSVDLNEASVASNEIVADNIRAAAAIYFASQLEQLQLFNVVDRIVQQFQAGMLPIGNSPSGKMLYEYSRAASSRLAAPARSSVFARVLGAPGGDPGGTPNREFNALWLRFIAAVQQMDQDAIGKSAHDLASNLSLNGYGAAYFAAAELSRHIQDAIRILQQPEVQSAFGARDMWQVIERVSTADLGGARPTARYRTLATAGATIIVWIATHAELIRRNQAVVLKPSPVPPPGDPLASPSDEQLIDAVTQWRAAAATDNSAQLTHVPTVFSVPEHVQTNVDVSEHVRVGVRDILTSSPSYRSLPPKHVQSINGALSQLAQATHAAASAHLAQQSTTPAIHTHQPNLASITASSLANAVDFPSFVADVVKGTFQAITDSNIQQMQAYSELLNEVARTTDGSTTEPRKKP